MWNKSNKWFLLALLFVTFFLAQGTRQVYNAVLPQISIDFKALGISDAHLGLVGSVFSVVFGLSLVGSGLAADFLGRKRVLVLGTFLFSLGVLGCGFSNGLLMMILAYGVLTAFGQCCVAPPCYSLISQYHVGTRSVAMAIFQGAVYSGVILSSLFAGELADLGSEGWRWAFWVLGAVGIAWSTVLLVGLRETPLVSVAGKPKVSEAFYALLKKPTAVLIAISFGFFMYAQLGIRLWTPLFLARTYEGVGVAKAAFNAVIWVNLGACISSLLTARFTDRIAAKRPRIRIEMSMVGLLSCMTPVFLVSQAQTFPQCCLMLFVYGLTYGIYDGSHYPAMFDCIEPRYRSVSTGLTGCYAFVFGSAGPFLLGLLGGCFSMRIAIASLCVFYLAGAITLLPAIFKYFIRDYVREGQVK